MDTSTRLRIATRIHFALLRRYGEHIEVGSLMKAGADVREALWVCEASGDAELRSMARQLKLAERADTQAAAIKTAAPQDAAWAHNTTGFGVSGPIELDHPVASTSSWLKPSSWLRRAAPARHH